MSKIKASCRVKRRSRTSEELALLREARQHQAEKRLARVLTQFPSLPNEALVNIKVVASLTGRSTSSLWRDVRFKRFASPVQVGPRATRWRVGDIRKAIEGAAHV